MKTLNEMYKLVLKTMKEHGQRNDVQDTLVWLVSNRKITTPEHCALMSHYRLNKPSPTQHTKFYNHPMFSKNPKKRDWYNYINKDSKDNPDYLSDY